MSEQRSMQTWTGLVVCALVCTAGQSGARAAEAKRMTQPIQDGMKVSIDYTLTVDGQVVDSSKGRGPLTYVQGRRQIIPGLERQLTGLSAGDTKNVTVAPEDGYGQIDPKAFVEVGRAQLPPGMTPAVGQVLQGTSQDGHPFRATIHTLGEDTVTLDLNHPLAGKTLLFHVTVVNIEAVQ